MKEIRSDLVAHLGGAPSATQSMLIDRAAALTLRLELMDRRALRAAVVPETDGKQYLAWSNALSRLLRQLGMKPTAQRTPTLADHLARQGQAA